MFDKLRNKWNVGLWQLILIICTFAIGGSLCGYAGKKIMTLLPIDKGVLWFVIYLVIITILWPLAVLIISLPLGQFRFFKGYIGKIARRMGLIK